MVTGCHRVVVVPGGNGSNPLQAMKEAGFFVPDSFDKLPDMINQVYTQLVMEGEIVETPEGETPQA